MDKGIYVLMVDETRKSIYAIGAKSFNECLKNIEEIIRTNDLKRYNIEDINKFSIEVRIPAEELLKHCKSNH